MRPRSAPPPSLKKPSTDEAKSEILRMMERSERPVLIGIASTQLPCWTIQETEQVFQELLADGSIRQISPVERKRFDIQEGYVRAGVISRK
jgi:hypothetical protein